MNELEFNWSHFNKTVQLLHTYTRMDTRFVDHHDRLMLQLVDHFMPAALQQSDYVYPSIKDDLQTAEPNKFFYYINTFGLEYIAVGVRRNQAYCGFVLTGPFLSSIPDTDFISDIIVRNNLPVSERKQLQEFYRSLSVISSNDSNSLGDLIVNLCLHPHTDSQLVTPEIVQPILDKVQQETKIAESKTTIEFRYEIEKELMSAIAKGDKVKLAKIFREGNSFSNISDRIPESPLRSAKNLLITLNTLCRVAAERGGLHPVYLDTISERFSITIERATNLPNVKKLNSVIMQEYCNAVHEFSTRKYSVIVKNAVNYIDMNLEKPLTLQHIATNIHVNPSHLSRKFKQEVRMTMMDYINQKRIEESKLYLQRGMISITEVAFMVGFNDLNYFTRVFKKYTSITPTQYVKTAKT
ncbi:AraC family transcriptional regulator [Paenibacillus antarcticus]|uniref:AraC family transcriptional regulator n=1 Tax=Paenibacillus antarcticus TaxID=253703 RepID=A0A162PYN4_9BACL|nr:AraC family transcriptional regulator [Paenibacillus antarcticus]